MTIQKKRGLYSNFNKNKSVGISKIQEEVKLERNQSEIKIRKGVNNKFRVQIPQNKSDLLTNFSVQISTKQSLRRSVRANNQK